MATGGLSAGGVFDLRGGDRRGASSSGRSFEAGFDPVVVVVGGRGGLIKSPPTAPAGFAFTGEDPVRGP